MKILIFCNGTGQADGEPLEHLQPLSTDRGGGTGLVPLRELDQVSQISRLSADAAKVAQHARSRPDGLQLP